MSYSRIKSHVASDFFALLSRIVGEVSVADSPLDTQYLLAFYWAVTTMTTVGYGDRYPTSAEGKFLAVGLMVVGISLMGVITASVAAWFVKMGDKNEN